MSKPAEALFVALGGPSGGVTLALVGAIEAVDVGLIVYGGAIAASIVARSFHDNLFVRFANDEFNTRGGGDPSMFGAKGTQFTSKTFWKSKSGGRVRLDAENPNPGIRPGQIHIQDKMRPFLKYHYNPLTRWFDKLPNDIEKMASNDPAFKRALETALRYMGE